MIEKSPFDLHKKLLRAYAECHDYFSELSEFKIKQLEQGVTTEKGTMDVMGQYVSMRIVVDSDALRPTCQGFREKSRGLERFLLD